MKLNWGKSIGIFYTAFVLVMVFIVFLASRNDVQLEREDYYNLDLNYEAFRQARENGKKEGYHVGIVVDKQNHVIEIIFPESAWPVSGETLLYRPSDKNADRKYKIQVDTNGRMLIPTAEIQKGLWKVEIEWKSNDVPVYSEKVITI